MKAGQIWSNRAPNGQVFGYRVTVVFPKSASVHGDCGFVWVEPVKRPGWAYSFPTDPETDLPFFGTWELIEDVP